MTRNSALSRKVNTNFGSMFFGVQVDDQGRPCGFHIAPPQKLENSEVGKLLDTIVKAADDLMRDAIAAADCEAEKGRGR
jgi:hypothetical protein